MELQNLSSNWKKLQQQLRKDQVAQPTKRKASDPATHSPGNLSKKRKLDLTTLNGKPVDERGPTKTGRMSLSTSTVVDPTTAMSMAVWAKENDIAANDLVAAYGPSSTPTSSRPALEHGAETTNVGLSPSVEAGKYIAIDCEMVGVGPPPAEESALARVSLVDYHGQQLYDSFVRTKERVTDYRSAVSGITAQLLQTARSLEEVQADVARLLDGKILVGHAIRHDLAALMLGHPRRDIRDTSRHPAFRQLVGGRTPGLKKLAKDLLGIDIQDGAHSSVEDARTTMLLFRREKEGFDREHVKRWGSNHKADGSTRARKGKKGKKGGKTKRG